MDEESLNEIRERRKDKKKFAEQKKNGIRKYLERITDFINGKMDALNLTDGYNIIERSTFEMEFIPKIISIEKPNRTMFKLSSIYSYKIEQRIGSPFGNAMGIDDTGLRGTSKPEQLSGFKFECPNEECKKQIQLIQHDVFAIRDKEDILISIKPIVECPHCSSQFNIERSKVKPRRY